MGFLTATWRRLATPGLETFPYEVSDWGDVRRIGEIEPLKPWKGGPNGDRPKVSLYPKSGARKVAYVAHLVAHAHLGDQPAGTEVHHKDGDPSGNDMSNLQYVTPSRNARLRFSEFGGADDE